MTRDASHAATAGRGGHLLELTVLGCAPSAPQLDGQGSGLLVRDGSAALLLDCGMGVVPRLMRVIDPSELTAVVVTHLHADHFLDLVSLRYLLPWPGVDGPRLPILLPPGGRAGLEALSRAISEAPDFFTRALDLREYDPGRTSRVGAMELSFFPTRHYIPGWAVAVALDDGPRIVYTGDTGPSPTLARACRGADLLVVEATLAEVEEDVAERGHLTPGEAVAMALDAGVPRVILTHLPTARRAAIRAGTAGGRPRVHVARPGLRVAVRRRSGR